MSVSYGGDSITFSDNTVQSSSATGFKNRVINGDMRINQRQNTAMTLANTSAYYYATDRNMWYMDTSGVVGTALQSSVAPNGFANSIAITVTTGQTPVAGAQNILAHFIEYNNVVDLAWGTADAKPVTISFWVKSSLTGTFGGGVYNYAYNKNYIYAYTINQANTWEQKTITIPGSTDGDWTSQGLIGRGIILRWDIGSGTDFQTGTYNQWGTALKNSVTGATRVIANSGATFHISGIQLEKGASASSFEYRPIQTELQLCQRYYQAIALAPGVAPAFGLTYSTTAAACSFRLIQEMRVAPSVTLPAAGQTSNTISFLNSSGYPSSTGTHSVSQTSTYMFNIYGTGYTGLGGSAQSAWLYYGSGGSTGYIRCDAEL